MKDLYNNVKVTQVYDPALKTASITSNTIDMQGYNSLVAIATIGATGDTLSGSVYWTVSIEESDDDSTYTEVAAADLHNGVNNVVIDDNSEDQIPVKYGYKGSKRYLRVKVTKTGTHTNGTPMGVIALRSHAADLPVA